MAQSSTNRPPTSVTQDADSFLEHRHLFQLGRLPTEAPHPKTQNLSRLAQEDLSQALRLLQSLDLATLEKLKGFVPQLEPLQRAISATLESGGRIFLCGCGATGRLSLSLEYLWRQQYPDSADRVTGFMAGGDVALVHSLEGFEDFPEYGAEQLIGLGFGENDLLISCTEGGETPFVIGATEAATRVSGRAPFFLYCNPREILVELVERSRRVLENPKINCICLQVGPMALSGSTRMQASTVLMLGVGLALLAWEGVRDTIQRLAKFSDHYRFLPITKIAPMTVAESAIYQRGDRLLMSVQDFAITVFTDTTERAPTFSLAPFNNQLMPRQEHSLAYVCIPEAQSAGEAWRMLLGREPRALEWLERNPKTSYQYLLGFDFSRAAKDYRKRVLPGVQHVDFTITKAGAGLRWSLQGESLEFPSFQRESLYDHMALKMLLNSHSTLIMGRLGRYVGNLMTWVHPTNGKLIDRATRYVIELLRREGISVSYEQAVRELFRQIPGTAVTESVVLRTQAVLRSAKV